MNFTSSKKTLSRAYLRGMLAAAVASLSAAAIFTVFPLRPGILTVFANIVLAVAAFYGSFYQARRTPFFSPGRAVALAMAFIATVALLMTFTTGIDLKVLAAKGIAIVIATICGEIFGRL